MGEARRGRGPMLERADADGYLDRADAILVKTGPAGCDRAGPKFQESDYATRPGQLRYTALSKECP